MPNLSPIKEATLSDRERKIWAYRVKGWTQQAIADKLEVDQSVVCRAIKRAAKKHHNEFMENIHEFKLEQSAIIEELAMSTLKQYYESQKDFIKTTQSGKMDKEGKKFISPITTIEKSKQYGDTKLLGAFFKCVEELRKIWGIDYFTKDAKNPLGEMTVEEKIALFTSMPIEDRLKMLSAMITNRQGLVMNAQQEPKQRPTDDQFDDESFE